MEVPINSTEHPYTLLVGEGTTPERLAIRAFKYLMPEGPYARTHQQMVQRLEGAFSAHTFETVKAVWHDDSIDLDRYDFNDFSNVAPVEEPVLAKLKTHLIAPKIITGDITRLMISPVEEHVLPRGMVNTFRRINTSSRRDTMIEGYDDYYAVTGQLNLGGRSLASVACGICLSPYSKVIGTHSPNRLAFRAQVVSFGAKDRNDIQEWQASVDAAKDREAHARLHPFNGGLVNPS